jgi:serine/threonine protein kinase
MEYIEGDDLEQRLTHTDRQGRQIPGRACAEDEVIRWGIALCKVLEYLASLSPSPVVHHDIKPANIILDKNSGEVRLVDFGTAKARLQQQAGGAVGMQQSSLYGTTGYAAPEQYRRTSEPRSDVYALAATLYHLATDDDPGVHPFTFQSSSGLGS